MALQLIVQVQRKEDVLNALGKLIDSVELFPIEGALWGISVPTKVIGKVGEQVIQNSLSKLNVYDLYSGEWRYA